MTYQPGEVLFGKYRIEAHSGSGAFGEVYRATHVELNISRALKILRSDMPGVSPAQMAECEDRFRLEMQLGARLGSHPNLIQVHDVARDSQTLALVMEYCPGGSLADRLEAARQRGAVLPVEECVNIALDAARGLAAMHTQGIVHRDLKPANILFTASGQAKIADLGLAQIPSGPSLRSGLSQAQPHPGTPGYMSPEQATQSGFLKPASDVYALGLVLFEMLTGRSYVSLRPGARPGELRPEIPQWLDVLLLRMLSDKPAARPWDGKEAAACLQNRQFPKASFSPTPQVANQSSQTQQPNNVDASTLQSETIYSEKITHPEAGTMPSKLPPEIILFIVFATVVIIAILALVILGK